MGGGPASTALFSLGRRCYWSRCINWSAGLNYDLSRIARNQNEIERSVDGLAISLSQDLHLGGAKLARWGDDGREAISSGNNGGKAWVSDRESRSCIKRTGWISELVFGLDGNWNLLGYFQIHLSDLLAPNIKTDHSGAIAVMAALGEINDKSAKEEPNYPKTKVEHRDF